MRLERLSGAVEESVGKALVVAVTAAPGVHRLVFITVLSAIWSAAEVGLAAADLGIASFLAILSGGAVSGQVMAKWARYPGSRFRTVLAFQGFWWQLGALPIAGMVAWVLHRSGLVDSLTSTLLFFLGFSIWQIERTKLLSDRRIILLAGVEVVLLLVVSFAVMLAGSASSAVGIYGATLLLAGVTVAPVAMRTPRGCEHYGRESCEGLGYRDTATLAANGVVSSGREQLTVPAIKLVADSSMAGLVAQVSVMVASVLLLPRALANHYVPELSRNVGGRDTATEILSRYRRAMHAVLIGITAAFLGGIALCWAFGIARPLLPLAALVGFMMIFGQASLLPSTVLTVQQRVAPILMSALTVTSGWAVVVAALAFSDVSAWLAAVLMLGFSLFAAAARASYLHRVMDRNFLAKSGESAA